MAAASFSPHNVQRLRKGTSRALAKSSGPGQPVIAGRTVSCEASTASSGEGEIRIWVIAAFDRASAVSKRISGAINGVWRGYDNYADWRPQVIRLHSLPVGCSAIFVSKLALQITVSLAKELLFFLQFRLRDRLNLARWRATVLPI